MSDTITSVEGVFASPEFGLQLTEWQRTRMRTNDAGSALESYLTEGYQDEPGMSQNEIDGIVEEYLEFDDESFSDIFAYDEQALVLRRNHKDREREEAEAKSWLLQVARDAGLGQFGLYGLDLHAQGYEPISAPALRAKVEGAEADFRRVEDFVRNNSGRLLTVLDTTIFSGIVGEGGLTIDDKGNHVTIPIAPGTKSYLAAGIIDSTKLYPEDKMVIPTHYIHSILGSSRAKFVDDPSQILDDAVWRLAGDTYFIAGEIPAGPPFVPEEREVEYRTFLVNQMRALGRAVVHSSNS